MFGPPGAPSDTAVNPRPRQMTLPGLGEKFLPRPTLQAEHGGEDDPTTPSREQVKLDALADYGGPDGAHDTGPGLSEPNPIYDVDVWTKNARHSQAMFNKGVAPSHQTEFVPPWRVNSSQSEINPQAVEHQVKNANPLDLVTDPEMTAYRDVNSDGDPAGDERYMVYDGNHRVNAAQRRGQLLMPANVARYPDKPPSYQRGSNATRRSRA